MARAELLLGRLDHDAALAPEFARLHLTALLQAARRIGVNPFHRTTADPHTACEAEATGEEREIGGRTATVRSASQRSGRSCAREPSDRGRWAARRGATFRPGARGASRLPRTAWRPGARRPPRRLPRRRTGAPRGSAAAARSPGSTGWYRRPCRRRAPAPRHAGPQPGVACAGPAPAVVRQSGRQAPRVRGGPSHDQRCRRGGLAGRARRAGARVPRRRLGPCAQGVAAGRRDRHPPAGVTDQARSGRARPAHAALGAHDGLVPGAEDGPAPAAADGGHPP